MCIKIITNNSYYNIVGVVFFLQNILNLMSYTVFFDFNKDVFINVN